MLNHLESEVMKAVFDLCDGSKGCFVSPNEILALLPSRKKITPERVEEVLFALQMDGYFELLTSERKGEKTYVITLKESGLTFERVAKQTKRDILFKIFLAFVGASATFVFGLLLRAIFGQG
jgi:hypothetical protein